MHRELNVSQSRGPLRVLSVLAASAAGLVGAGLLLVDAGHRSAALRAVPAVTLAPDEVIGALAETFAGLLLGWLALGTLLALVAALPTTLAGAAGRWSARVTPALLRSVVAAAVGGSVVVGAAATATATVGPTQVATQTITRAASTATPVTTGPVLPDPGWTPEPPPAPPLTRPGDVSLVSATAAPGRAVEDHVVVRRGDTLWAIAARHLGPAADPAQIAREWPRWYAANRQVIGPDPDRLHPGQLLRPPAQAGAAHR
jgi:nucleoid-associated protein YgaU